MAPMPRLTGYWSPTWPGGRRQGNPPKPAPAPADKTTQPSLPPELLSHILSQFPPPAYASPPTHLSTLALVRPFSDLALRELYRHVFLPTIPRARAFLDALWKDPRKAEDVESVRMGKAFSSLEGKAVELERVLRECSGVKELWLLSYLDLGMGTLQWGQSTSIQAWALCELIPSRTTDLTSLHIFEARITLSTASSSFSLPSLTTLSLNRVILAGPAILFLSPSALPSLTSLEYLSIHLTPQPLQPPFLSLAPQLHRLAIGGGYAPVFEDVAACTRLRILDVPGSWVAEQDPSSLPPSLTSLRLRCDPTEPQCIPFVRSCTSLRIIYLSAADGGPVDFPPELADGVRGVHLRRGEEWDVPKEAQADAPFREDFERFGEEVRRYEGARV